MAKKIRDMSSTSVITFKMQTFDIDDRGKSTKTIMGERMVYLPLQVTDG